MTVQDELIELQLLREELKKALNKIAKPLEIIEFSRENYNKLFPEGYVNSPIEKVKLGEHQFEKLDVKERQQILKAVFDVLKTPDIVINEERETVFGDKKPSHVYAKSFEFNGKNKAVQSIVVAIEDENVSISTHQRDINNVVNKIKNARQLIYVSDEVGQVIERITVNPTRVNIVPPVPNISQSQEKSIELLKKENERLRKENMELGKQIMKIAYQQTKNEKQNLSQNKTKSKDDDLGYDRAR